MNNKTFSQKAPCGYGHCFYSECVAANQCLRNLATQTISSDEVNVTIINPALVRPDNGSTCPYFHEAKRIRIPYGFKRTLNNLTRADAATVRSTLIAKFSYKAYYNYLNGTRRMPEERLETVIKTLQKHGASAPVEFDRYEENFDW